MDDMNSKLKKPTARAIEEIGENDSFQIEIVDLKQLAPAMFELQRRKHYSVVFIQGDCTVEFADQTHVVAGSSLLFTTPKIPFGLKLADTANGVACIFSEHFISRQNNERNLKEFPIFKPGLQHVCHPNAEQQIKIGHIFDQMPEQQETNYAFKYDLLRTYLLQLIHHGQQMNPDTIEFHIQSASQQVSCSFVRLLEQQFPITSIDDRLHLRTPKEFADAMALHPNYLNRQIKAFKGQTTSQLIAERILQEAKILLKITSWNVAEIAYSLGFEEVSHFNAFFRKNTGFTPTEYKNQPQV